MAADSPADGASLVTVRPAVPVRLGRVEIAGRIHEGRGVHPRSARRYPSHAVMLVMRGTGVYRDGRGTVALVPGSAVVVRPGVPHWYGPPPEARWDEVYCAFTGPLFDLAARTGALGGEPVTRLPDPDRLAAHIEAVRLRPPPRSVHEQDAEALDLLAVLEQALAPAGGDPAAPTWLARSMHLLAADPGDGLTDIAAALGMPYETWRRRFKERVGMPPAQYRRDSRLRSAASLLTMTSLPVVDIAHRTGFVDDRHLSRHFRRRFGTTPSGYRRAAAGPHGPGG